MTFFHFFTSLDFQISFLFYFFLSLFFPFSCRLALSSKASFTPPTPWWALPTPSNPLSSRASWSNHCSTLNCRLPTTLRKDQGVYNIWFQHLGRHLGGQHLVQLFVVSSPSVPQDWGSVWVKVIFLSNTSLKMFHITNLWTMNIEHPLNINSIKSLNIFHITHLWTSFEHQQHHIIELHVINSTYLNIFWKSKAPHPSAYPASFISYTSCSICSTFYIDTFSPLFKFALYWSCLGSLLLLTKGTINFCGRWTGSLHRRSYWAEIFCQGKMIVDKFW